MPEQFGSEQTRAVLREDLLQDGRRDLAAAAAAMAELRESDWGFLEGVRDQFS
jgi:hypothetical protein